ncbi:MAG TPA: TolC family outer membrane protein [Gammaproteobacteria bacterium]|jgi:outer membrane protein|nr:TolC family outer membrane protein [Gammaproteobacteria bacterium]
MKKSILLAICIIFSVSAHATQLLEVYQQALISDPIFQQAIAQRLSTKEGVPISIAALLPTISTSVNPTVTHSAISGSALDSISGRSANPRNNTARTYNLMLTATQTVFNYAQFASVSGARSLSKGADATLNAALQNLMVRVASAYFAILRDEDNLSYSKATKAAFAQQLNQIKQQFKVGLKTTTDLYTAQASYDSAVANYITTQTILANDRENLRAITNTYYPHLSSLSEKFPLTSPDPHDIEKWVHTSERQNWTIKSSQYNVQNALQVIKQQFAGHLPTVNIQGSLNREYQNNINGYQSLLDNGGAGVITNKAVAINISLPLFAGGGVVAQTNQATYDYQVAQQQLEQVIRSTLNATRQSYLNVTAGISQIAADKETVKSTISSLRGMEASYAVGTETLVNVLNQQQNVFQAQTRYAIDRYAFVNNVLQLKQAAGTLSFEDLQAINQWLIH